LVSGAGYPVLGQRYAGRYNSKKKITMIPFTEVERDYKILLGKFVDQTRFPHTGGLYKRQETRIQ
jgi:hypothetical protein